MVHLQFAPYRKRFLQKPAFTLDLKASTPSSTPASEAVSSNRMMSLGVFSSTAPTSATQEPGTHPRIVQPDQRQVSQNFYAYTTSNFSRKYLRLGQGILNWIVYILRCADGTLYTGITNDLDRRMSEHGSGRGAKYTKGRGPFQLVYNESCGGKGQASKREIEIKLLNRKQKLRLVSANVGVASR